jgi:hypothetical protein
MPHVFISYVKENLDEVCKIVDVLKEFKVEVWLDRTALPPALPWKTQIRTAIEAGNFFLACFSTAYWSRDKTYMNEELNIAIEQLRQRHSSRAWFIPVKLDACEIPDIDIGASQTLRSLQWIEFGPDWADGMEKILSVITPGLERVPALVRLLDDDSAYERLKAIHSLAKLGPLARSACPRLLRFIPDRGAIFDRTEAEEVEAAWNALDSIGSCNPGIDAKFRSALKKFEDAEHFDALYDQWKDQQRFGSED